MNTVDFLSLYALTHKVEISDEIREAWNEYNTKENSLSENNGSLSDRGRADKYYGRPKNPHWYPLGTYNGPAVDQDLDEEQVAAYMTAYENETDSKDWF
jgi:hypothetical protein